MYTMRKTEGIIYNEAYPKECLLDLWMPETDSPVPLFLYFHGGGLESGRMIWGSVRS